MFVNQGLSAYTLALFRGPGRTEGVEVDSAALKAEPLDQALKYAIDRIEALTEVRPEAGLSEDDMRINREKQAHDLKAFAMWYDVMAANLTRDFGITREQSTRRDESGRVFLNDMEVTHPEFGKLGEIKGGRFWISGEDGALIHPEVYFGNRPA